MSSKRSKNTPQVAPPAPTKPLTAFLMYRMAVFKKVKAEHPDKKIGQLSKVIG